MENLKVSPNGIQTVSINVSIDLTVSDQVNHLSGLRGQYNQDKIGQIQIKGINSLTFSKEISELIDP